MSFVDAEPSSNLGISYGLDFQLRIGQIVIPPQTLQDVTGGLVEGLEAVCDHDGFRLVAPSFLSFLGPITVDSYVVALKTSDSQCDSTASSFCRCAPSLHLGLRPELAPTGALSFPEESMITSAHTVLTHNKYTG